MLLRVGKNFPVTSDPSMLKIGITVKRYNSKKQFKLTFKSKLSPRKEKGTKQHPCLTNSSFPFLIPGHSMISGSCQCGIS